MEQQTEMIPYSRIGGTSPAGLERPRRRLELKAWHVLVFFLADMTVFLIAGSRVQYYLGMAGVAVTETFLLVTSLLFVRVAGADFRTVFPLKKIRPLAMAGTLVIWAGGFLAVIVCNVILLFLFPEGFLGSSQSFSAVAGSVPWPVAFLIIAVLPAVCEEAMHRGVIQCGIQNSVHGKWRTVLIMGLLFGAFHLSPVKFPGTGILGAVMSYLLLITGNMLYSCFFHFFHNALQVLFLTSLPALLNAPLSGLSGDLTLPLAAPGTAMFTVGFYILIMGTGVPILLYTGSWLVRRGTAPVRPSFLPEGRKRAALCAILAPTCLLLLAGVLLCATGLSQLMTGIG